MEWGGPLFLSLFPSPARSLSHSSLSTTQSAIHDRGVIALLIHKLAALPRAAAARAAAKAARARDPAKAGRGAKERGGTGNWEEGGGGGGAADAVAG